MITWFSNFSHRVETAIAQCYIAEVKNINRKLDKIMAQLDDLEAQVKANTDVEASAVALIQGLHDQLVAAGTDPAKLDALKTNLESSAGALAAAVSANTPAANP